MSKEHQNFKIYSIWFKVKPCSLRPQLEYSQGSQKLPTSYENLNKTNISVKFPWRGLQRKLFEIADIFREQLVAFVNLHLY